MPKWPESHGLGPFEDEGIGRPYRSIETWLQDGTPLPVSGQMVKTNLTAEESKHINFKSVQNAIARLETDSGARKEMPIYSGVFRYFPDALAEVARLSKVGGDKHHPGQPMHWERSKSTDELDCLCRHLAEAGTIDTDGLFHDVKIAWRALANLQKLLERERGLSISPGSKP